MLSLLQSIISCSVIAALISIFQHDEGFYAFSTVSIAHPDHCQLFYGRVSVKQVFYLSRKHAEAGALDQFPLPTKQLDVAFFVHQSGISGVEPIAP